MNKARQTIERGVGYKIYFYKDIFFVDFGKNKSDGYDSLDSAREAVYYKGLRETKN